MDKTKEEKVSKVRFNIERKLEVESIGRKLEKLEKSIRQCIGTYKDAVTAQKTARHASDRVAAEAEISASDREINALCSTYSGLEEQLESIASKGPDFQTPVN